MLYCIEIIRELEEPMIEHKRFAKEPTRKEVLEFIKTLDIGYDDDYEEFRYWKVNV